MTGKLSHLTDYEIGQLIEEYYAGTRISDLLSKYQIDVQPGQLVKTFPSKKLEATCLHCGTNLIQEYVSKTSYYSSAVPSCPNCGHKASGSCNCPNCKELAKRAIALEKAKQEALQKEMREQLTAVINSMKVLPLEYDNLSFEHKIYLGAALRVGISEEYNYVRPFEEFTSPLTPTEKFDAEIFNSLTNSQKALIVSPASNLSAFTRDDNGVFRYSAYSVAWSLNVTMGDVTKVPLIDSIMNPTDINSTPEQRLGLWRKIALAEVLEDLLESVNTLLNTDFVIGDKTIATFSQLLKDYSTAQIYGIIHNAVNQALRFKAEHKVPNKHAANFIVGSALSYGERAIANGWVLKNWGRKRERHISALSRFYFERVLQIGDLGFSACPSLELVGE